MNKIRAHIFVSGRVQGVFFRVGTRKKANKFGVSGFVRNLSDGRVEAVLEGEKEAVEKVIRWAQKGSFFSKVDNLEIKPEEYRGDIEGFEIRY